MKNFISFFETIFLRTNILVGEMEREMRQVTINIIKCCIYIYITPFSKDSFNYFLAISFLNNIKENQNSFINNF